LQGGLTIRSRFELVDPQFKKLCALQDKKDELTTAYYNTILPFGITKVERDLLNLDIDVIYAAIYSGETDIVCKNYPQTAKPDDLASEIKKGLGGLAADVIKGTEELKA
jgi:hypothetical protein